MTSNPDTTNTGGYYRTGSALSRSTLELSDGYYLSKRDRSVTRNSESGYSSSFRDRDLSLSRPETSSSFRNRCSSVNARDDYTSTASHLPTDPIVTQSSAYIRDRSSNREPYSPTRDYYSVPTSTSGARCVRLASSLNPDPIMMNGFDTPSGGTAHHYGHDQRNTSRSRDRDVALYERERYPPNYSPALRHQPHAGTPRSNLVRSNSYRDLRDFDPDYIVPPSNGGYGSNWRSPIPYPSTCIGAGRSGVRGRARHQTLAYGVSAEDLALARNQQHQDMMMYDDWRAHVPLVGAGTSTGVAFRGGSNAELRGFASDMSGQGLVSKKIFVIIALILYILNVKAMKAPPGSDSQSN